MVIKREIEDRIEEKLFKGKAVVIYGARRVGKTTLILRLKDKYGKDCLYLNCDEPDIRDALTDKTSTELRAFTNSKRLIFLDEAQRVKNIGLTIKLLVDNFPHIQVVATGSSSFDLSNEIVEPLTGRKYEFYLYPFSLTELKKFYTPLELNRIIEKRMVFGMCPETIQNEAEAETTLRDIRRSYLFKDILEYQQVKNPQVLEKLLSALALQLGSEVSYTELASLLGIDKKTVERYIDLLAKAFVIFPLRPFSRNLRKEISKMRKIYFVDVGVRNALINNFNPPDLRQDTGSLWENFLISERLKRNNNGGFTKNTYFWRTYSQQELDYLEEEGGKLFGFEFKWGKKKSRLPKIFGNIYPNSKLMFVNRDNFGKFVGLEE